MVWNPVYQDFGMDWSIVFSLILLKKKITIFKFLKIKKNMHKNDVKSELFLLSKYFRVWVSQQLS